MIDWGRETCGNLAVAERREWLCTNGLGGFASGTVAGLLSRRYHGLLVAALAPPLGRTLLVAKVEETLVDDERRWPLSTNRWGDGSVNPRGHDPYTPLMPERQRRVVDVCARQLLTSHGLRSLAPGHRDYQGAYMGDPRSRDGAYHQGTVWSWLLGPLALAHFRVHGDRAAARGFLEPLAHHLADYGVGSIAEVFDGEPPFRPGGCVAQAWSVAETLRAWQLLTDGEPFPPLAVS